jgi:very-short-patch-repair endonuclease
VADLADRQHGIVTQRQLLDAGLSAQAIARRRRRRALRPLYRGVYAVGHLGLTPAGQRLAAVLACGPRAVLSHTSAAAAWAMRPEDGGPFHVTVVGRDCRPRTGIRIHRVAELAEVDIRVREGIRITSPGRTVFDLASVLPAREVERALDEGRVKRLLTPNTLAGVIERYPRRRGVRALQPLVDPRRPSTETRSDTEERFLALIRRAGLPAPELNARVGRYSIDAYWRERGVAVELDGYGYHSTRFAFERDHAKDLFLRTRGIDAVRFTRGQVIREPEVVLVAVAGALARSSAARRRRTES